MSTTFEVAHFREQGQDIIAVAVADSFGHRSNAEQNRIRDLLQTSARSAGLTGHVVPVWNGSNGCMGFLAPEAWHGFFSSLSIDIIAQNINRTLTCNW